MFTHHWNKLFLLLPKTPILMCCITAACRPGQPLIVCSSILGVNFTHDSLDWLSMCSRKICPQPQVPKSKPFTYCLFKCPWCCPRAAATHAVFHSPLDTRTYAAWVQICQGTHGEQILAFAWEHYCLTSWWFPLKAWCQTRQMEIMSKVDVFTQFYSSLNQLYCIEAIFHWVVDRYYTHQQL